jgi:hypothetical protein
MENADLKNSPFGAAQALAKRYKSAVDNFDYYRSNRRTDGYKRYLHEQQLWKVATAVVLDLQTYEMTSAVMTAVANGEYWE